MLIGLLGLKKGSIEYRHTRGWRSCDTTNASEDGLDEQPDDSEPTLERQAELAEGYARNRGRSDYRGRFFAIRTRGELLWLMRDQGWSGEVEDSPRERRVALCAVSFRGVNLQNIHLYNAALQDSFFKDANLRSAILIGAHLLDTSFSGANLESAQLVGVYAPSANFNEANLCNANLMRANMSHCGLRSADLRGAKLWNTDLTEADLSSADLRGANLRGCQINGRTVLDGIITDEHTRWINGLPMSRANR